MGSERRGYKGRRGGDGEESRGFERIRRERTQGQEGR